MKKFLLAFIKSILFAGGASAVSMRIFCTLITTFGLKQCIFFKM